MSLTVSPLPSNGGYILNTLATVTCQSGSSNPASNISLNVPITWGATSTSTQNGVHNARIQQQGVVRTLSAVDDGVSIRCDMIYRGTLVDSRHTILSVFRK